MYHNQGIRERKVMGTLLFDQMTLCKYENYRNNLLRKSWYIYCILKKPTEISWLSVHYCAMLWKMHSLRTSKTAEFWSCFKYKSQHLLSSQCHLQCEIAGLAWIELRRLWPKLNQQNISGVHDHTHSVVHLCGDISITALHLLGFDSRSAGVFDRLLIVTVLSFFIYWLLEYSRTISAFSELVSSSELQCYPQASFS